MNRAREDVEPAARLVLLHELLTVERELRKDDAWAHDLDTYRALFTDPGEIRVVELFFAEEAGEDNTRRFRILKLHDEGGLGKLFVARDEQFDREVAIKKMKDEFVADEDLRARFIGEAEITGRLEHPSIPPIYARGCDRDENPFYAMRFIDGETFEKAIEDYHRGDPCGSDRAPARCAPQAARAFDCRLPRRGLRTQPGCLAPRHQASQRDDRRLRPDVPR